MILKYRDTSTQNDQIDRIIDKNVLQWFDKNPKFNSKGIRLDTAQFLQAKSNASTLLEQAKTKDEYKQIMKQIIASVDSEEQQDQEQDEASSSSISSVNLEFNNEDDCFGIFPPILKKK